MRFVSTNALQTDMIVAKTLYNASGGVLVRSGSKLRTNYIESIDRLGISGLYIDDKFSEEIDIKDVVSEELRIETASKIKSLFTTTTGATDKKIAASVRGMESLIHNVVDEVIQNRSTRLNLLDLKVYDDYTYQHSVNVMVLSLAIGTALGFNRRDLCSLGLAAALHDIGKMYVSIKILEKAGKLTHEEFAEIQKHPVHAFELLKGKFDMPAKVCLSVLQHHEKFNGTGYPNQKEGEDIIFPARIIAAADVYDAITSKRSYHDAILPSEAAEYIMGNSGMHFDPKVVTTFLKKVAVYPLGMCVELSNGMSGVVVENYEDYIMRPKIKLLPQFQKERMYIDLKSDADVSSVTIVKLMTDKISC